MTTTKFLHTFSTRFFCFLCAVFLLGGCGSAEKQKTNDTSAEKQKTTVTSSEKQETDVTSTETTASSDAFFYSFTDADGNEITLKEKPKKTAVLLSSFADIWQTAGGELYATVGESVERGLADEDILLVDSGAGKNIDTELLISYEPDFVICSADIAAQKETAELLKNTDIPCAQFRVESFDDYLSMLAVCTDITGDKKAFDTYGSEVQARIELLLNDYKRNFSEKDAPDILFIRAGSSYNATKAKTADENFVCAMLKQLGVYNIAENAPILLDGLSFEEILTSNPDYIFISTMGDETAAKNYMESVFQEDGYKQLSAVKEKRYAYLPKDLFQFKPNARWDEAYEYLINLLTSVEQE